MQKKHLHFTNQFGRSVCENDALQRPVKPGIPGGKIEMPMREGPFSSYFGMFADKYGIQWMVDFTSQPEK